MEPGSSKAIVERLRRMVVEPAADDELLRLFLSERNGDAFAAIMRRHGPLVLRVCRQLVSNPDDADDAFQATFLVLARRASSIRRGEVLGAWLHGVARRVAARIRAQRRHQASTVADLVAPPNAPGPETQEVWVVLHEEVQRLPAKYRLPVVLCYLEGKTHDDAAQLLGWPKGTVSGRLARARDLLYRRLTRRGVAVPAAAGISLLLWAGTAPAMLPAKLLSGASAAAIAYLSDQPGTGLVSASVISLTEGVLQSMFLYKSKLVGATVVLALTAIIAVGFALAGSTSEPRIAEAKQQPPIEKNAQPNDPELISAPLPAGKNDPQPEKQPAPPEAKNFKELQTIDTSKNLTFAAAISADGKTLVIACDAESEIYLWDIAGGAKTAAFAYRHLILAGTQIALSPDGKSLAAISLKEGAKVWDLSTKEEKLNIAWPQNGMEDPNTGKPVGGPVPAIMAVAISADVNRAATFDAEGKVVIWDLGTGKTITSFDAGKVPYAVLTFSPDGKVLAILAKSSPKLWDAGTGKEKATLPVHENVNLHGARGLRFSGDGNTLMAIGGQQLVFWDVAKMTKKGACIDQRIDFPSTVALSPDGKTVGIAASSKNVLILDVATGKEKQSFNWVSSPGDIVISPDGNLIASSRNGRTRIWQAERSAEKE